ncbi:proteasome assembly chaperone family protein [Haloarchaeobius sp. TZWWS8]|uniref:proteasome assembly chaperone family protein n=1 Tax=Haloarchaeobius sp. TZWWS8 TaxID=3446121 RepID=UPI003EBB802B
MDLPSGEGQPFHISHDETPTPTLIAGFSGSGLAGLVAAEFLVQELELEQIGHIVAETLPPFTPFEEGAPRHHSRLFADGGSGVTVLVNDLFIPPWATDSFGKAILEWADHNAVEEVTVLAGIPVKHGPTDRLVYYIATADYRDEHRLPTAQLTPMGRGFLEGVNASLMSRGIDSPLRVGLLVTPVRSVTPDIDAAVRLVEATSSLYGLDTDPTPLATFGAEVEQYYHDLDERNQREKDQKQSEDRMYM